MTDNRKELIIRLRRLNRVRIELMDEGLPIPEELLAIISKIERLLTDEPDDKTFTVLE